MCVCSVVWLCPILCNPMDINPPGSSVHGIFKARILEWVANSSSRRSSWLRDRIHISCVCCIISGFFTAESLGKPPYNYICGQIVKNPPASAGDVRDMGSIPGSGRSPGEGNSIPLQYCCLENSMDRGA